MNRLPTYRDEENDYLAVAGVAAVTGAVLGLYSFARLVFWLIHRFL